MHDKAPSANDHMVLSLRDLEIKTIVLSACVAELCAMWHDPKVRIGEREGSQWLFVNRGAHAHQVRDRGQTAEESRAW